METSSETSLFIPLCTKEIMDWAKARRLYALRQIEEEWDRALVYVRGALDVDGRIPT